VKVIEIRRHAQHSQLDQHLPQEGVYMARKLGNVAGPFERVITSPLPRARETSIAMGFAVNAEEELIRSGGGVFEKEAPWPQTFSGYSKAILKGSLTKKYAAKLFDYYAQIAESLGAEKAALVISHGGIVEIGAVACLPDADHDGWGPHLEFCEGVQLFWDDGKFQKAEILRIGN
jgi:broad specificity phosphatase PhoE